MSEVAPVYRALLVALSAQYPVGADDALGWWRRFSGDLQDQGLPRDEAEWRGFETLVRACEYSRVYGVDLGSAAEIVWGMRPHPGSAAEAAQALRGSMRGVIRALLVAIGVNPDR